MVCDALGAELRAVSSHTAADHVRAYSIKVGTGQLGPVDGGAGAKAGDIRSVVGVSTEATWTAILLLRADHTPCETKVRPTLV